MSRVSWAGIEALWRRDLVLLERRPAWILAAIGPPKEMEEMGLERHPAVARLVRIETSYKLANREFRPEKAVVKVGDLAFGGGRIFRELGDEPLPDWAAEFDCTSWAQFLLKYALSHPAATVAIPGMTKVRHVEDNLLAGHGRMPSPEHRKAMEALYDAL